MANSQVTVASRRTGEVWEAALVQDGRFMRALQGEQGDGLDQLLVTTFVRLLSGVRNEGTEVSINIQINEPDAD